MSVNGASRGRVGVGALHGGGGLEGQNGGPETSSLQLDHETDRDMQRETEHGQTRRKRSSLQLYRLENTAPYHLGLFG